MSEANVLLGYIEEPKPRYQSDEQIFRRLSDAVLQALPTDDAFPPLVRSMFAVTDDEHKRGAFRGRRLIHFAGNINYMIKHLSEWLDKFEPLLRRLYWTEAGVLVLNAWSGPALRLRYNITQETAIGYATSTPLPPQSWKFRAYEIGEREAFGNDLVAFLGEYRLLRPNASDGEP